jgi:hypothetical protein
MSFSWKARELDDFYGLLMGKIAALCGCVFVRKKSEE